eukprot:TRINITY_DN28999_c2_g1_i1.p2 TRINITY_DN28999_c2_g1~~TRINITY_DN28999_c2_g1_i1.p2  ORF type:complete len:107 (+),score=7.08 TRINITY_DN28999_c2_g1_i1:26-346(+)
MMASLMVITLTVFEMQPEAPALMAFMAQTSSGCPLKIMVLTSGQSFFKWRKIVKPFNFGRSASVKRISTGFFLMKSTTASPSSTLPTILMLVDAEKRTSSPFRVIG